MNQEIPKFTVVGRGNKGKSSIVSALAEDDSVVIEKGAGTTENCCEFPVRVDDKVQIILIDTPGFNEAPEVLGWMRAMRFRLRTAARWWQSLCGILIKAINLATSAGCSSQ